MAATVMPDNHKICVCFFFFNLNNTPKYVLNFERNHETTTTATAREKMRSAYNSSSESDWLLFISYIYISTQFPTTVRDCTQYAFLSHFHFYRIKWAQN